MTDARIHLKEKLEKIGPSQLRQPVMVGLDGFVDYIIDVVKTRQDFDHYTPMDQMSQLGEMVLAMAGKSCNIEFVVRQSKLGGNGPIMANALAKAGMEVTYIGALGIPLDPVFQEFGALCKEVYSVAGPGYTDALEFHDGKIMLGKHYNLNGVTWANLVEKMGPAKLAGRLLQSNLVAMTNWTMLPFMTEIWKQIQTSVLREHGALDGFLFIDLADPAKRTKEDILEALRTLEKFSAWYRVILGLNGSEGYQVARVLGRSFPEGADLQEMAEFIFSQLDLHNLVIHPTRFAVAADSAGSYRVDGPFCPLPKLTTGAGDNFNAGFCLGKLLGLSVSEALLCAVSSSGFYVRNGESATLGGLVQLLEAWCNNTLDA